MELRDKTEQEQQSHADMLAAAKNILESEGLTVLLTGSALLGAYRDGDLIPWCMGAVLTCFVHEITQKKEQAIIQKLFDADFKIVKHYKQPKNYKMRVDKGPFNIEIVAYNHRPGEYYRTLKRKEKIIPENLIQPPYKTIQLRGYGFVCPGDIEAFLSFVYLDWKTKIRSARPAEYKSKAHMVRRIH